MYDSDNDFDDDNDPRWPFTTTTPLQAEEDEYETTNNKKQ